MKEGLPVFNELYTPMTSIVTFHGFQAKHFSILSCSFMHTLIKTLPEKISLNYPNEIHINFKHFKWFYLKTNA